MASAEDANRPFAGLSNVSISEEIPVEGDITAPPGPSTRDDEFSTLDEPVKETILRDLRAVGNKFIHVLYPKRSSALLRDWDLWGPLLLCVTLALLLQGGAADSHDQGGPQFAEVTKLFNILSVLTPHWKHSYQ
ncbi:Yip1 member 6 [Ameca splendens]|uniref:Yip1 member 6 n=1 Tax=Ameca splendens TaxID=208324 RepID=A0ABV0Z435_9TELE